jgi:hypothetical protein
MKKLLIVFFCFPLFAIAQNFHFSARLGFAGYQGDLKAGLKPFSGLKLLGSLGARYDLSEHVTARSYLTLTSVAADDKNGTTSMKTRNLNFKSKIFDFELSAAYNFFSLNDRWWTPYVFAGVGFFHFNPYTNDTYGNKVYLQKLSTEGEGIIPAVAPYKKTQFSLPLGFGADYSLGEDSRIGLEFGYRKIFTDYLDDVSTNYVDETTLRNAKGQQAVDLAWRGDEVGAGSYPAGGTARGNPANNDAYYYVAVTFSLRYFFDKYKQIAGIPGGRKEKRVGCPATRGY